MKWVVKKSVKKTKKYIFYAKLSHINNVKKEVGKKTHKKIFPWHLPDNLFSWTKDNTRIYKKLIKNIDSKTFLTSEIIFVVVKINKIYWNLSLKSREEEEESVIKNNILNEVKLERKIFFLCNNYNLQQKQERREK